MSVLHVLLPLSRPDEDAALRRWLAKGDRLPDAAEPRAALVRGLFRFAGTGIPVAALRHHVHGADADHGTWMCADPVYVRSEATGARLMAWPLRDISEGEARELSTALMPLFGDAGLPLAVDTPSTWCLHLANGAPSVAFTRPADALGASLLDCLPAGEPGRRWRHLFNEAQITLHAHPFNAARTAAGKLPVNALWFWGAGALPVTVETTLTTVTSADDVIRGLSKLARIAAAEPSPGAWKPQPDGDGLLDLDTGNAVKSSQWLTLFERMLRSREFDAIELAFPGGERFKVRHAHRLRFWRRG